MSKTNVIKKPFTLSLILLALGSTSLFAQKETPMVPPGPYKITWSQSFGGTANDIGFSMCEFDTSEILVASYSYSDDGTITTPVHGDADWWAMKFTNSATPQLVWSYTFGGTMYEKLRQMSPSYNKKSYGLFGTTHSKDGDVDTTQLPKSDKDNWWLVKINDSGRILKQKLFVGSGNGECGGRSILPTSDNGYILLGWSNAQDNDFIGNYSAGFDGWVFKVDSNLNIQWRNHYGGTGSDGPIRMIRSGNYYYFTGGTSSNDHDFAGENHRDSLGKWTQDFGVWKTDTMGNIIWARCPGGTGKEFPFDIHADWDGNIVCGGYTTSFDGDVTGNHGGSKDGWLFKLNAVDGSLMWEKCFGGGSLDAIKRILPMPDHGFTLLCTSASTNDDAYGAGVHGGANDVWLLRIDSGRNVMYGRMFGGTDVEEALDLREFPCQGYLIMASTQSVDGDLLGVKSRKGEDVWLFFVVDSSLAINCDTITTGIHTGTPPAFTFSVNPNPVITSLNISYHSQENLQCQISDITGRRVTQFILYPSLRNKLFDASRLPQGMYIIKVKSAGGIITERKFIKQ